jgi:transcription elongation factor Elf1
MLTVACPTCGHRLGIPDNFDGEQFRCKQCGTSFQVSAPAPAPSGAGPFGLHLDDPSAGGAPPGRHAPLVPVSGQQDPNTIRFSCPRCRTGFESPASQAGTKFHCSACGQRIEVPAPPPNKTVLGSLDPLPPPVPHAAPPPVPLNRADGIPLAQHDNAPRMPAISINVNTSQPYPVEPPRPRRRPRRRYDDGYDDRYDGEFEPSGGTGMALGITSMVLGIVSLPFAIFPCLGLFVLPLAGLGLLLGFLGLVLGSSERRGSPGFGIAGLATSAVTLVLVLLWFALLPDFWGRRWWWR